MPVPLQIINWLERNYPKPRVDPEWLDACYTWVTTEFNLNPTTDLEKIIENVQSQLLQSDLGDSMLPGTGFPPNISDVDHTTLRGPPVLVEIVSMTEISVSALSLNQTRQVRIERMAAGEQDQGVGDADVEGEGPVPIYPRGMLKLELSDGATTLKAIEYRRLPELTLGVTPLGYKMLLRGVLVRRGIAFLEPKCVVMKGHQTEDRELQQDADFAKGLRIRLGLQDPEPVAENPVPAPASPQPPPPSHQNKPRPHPRDARSPLRTLSQPPSPTLNSFRSEDEEDQPRHRRVPNPTLASTTVSGSTLVQSSYFSSSASSNIGWRNEGVDLVLSPVRDGPIIIPSDDEENIEPYPESAPSTSHQGSKLVSKSRKMAEAKLTREKQGPKTYAVRDVKEKGKGKAVEKNAFVNVKEMSSDFDFGDSDIFMDDAFLEGLDQAEMEALGSGSGSLPHSTARSGASKMDDYESSNGREKSSAVGMDVITIDDDENDKENLPVPTRQVRRRTGSSSSERGAIITVNSDGVIDISDYDSV